MKIIIELLDPESISRLLSDYNLIGKRESVDIKELTGGVSNDTLLLTRESGEQWVVKQALKKLKVKEDWYSSTDRLGIEYKGMLWLSEVLPQGGVPMPVFFDKASNILVMEAVRQPFFNMKDLFMDGKFKEEWLMKMGRMLSLIHNKGYRSEEAKVLFEDRSFFKNLRLEPYYLFTAEQLEETSVFFQTLVNDTLSVQESIVHGDYSPKNILLKNDELVLLDHEVMHYGDPAFDVGFCMCHILSNAIFLTNNRKKFISGAYTFWNSYSESYINATQIESRAVRHTIGNLLARIKGRSPLAYLDQSAKERQLKIGLELIKDDINSIPSMIDLFSFKLEEL